MGWAWAFHCTMYSGVQMPSGVPVATVAIDGGAAINEVLALPPLSTVELPVVARALAQVAPDLPAPQQPGAAALPLLDAPCQPLLHLQTLQCWSWRKHRGYGVDFAGGMTIHFSPTIQVQGGAAEGVKGQITEALNLSLHELEQLIKRVTAQQARRAY